MNRKRIAVLASSTLLLAAGWLPLGIATTLSVGGATMVIGCGGTSERSDTRQDARVETRTEERVKSRRD